jgi:hypothetical protein
MSPPKFDVQGSLFESLGSIAANNYTAPATGTSDAFVALEGLVAEAP